MEPQRYSNIDLAKTIAVSAVFLFHSSATGLQAGFLGVDLFLVVTGYLTANTLSKISPTTFVMRRLKRVWPALIVMLILTTLIFFPFLFLSEAKQLSRDSFIATLFMGNYGTYFLSDGYFAASTHLSPIFHLWSIGLEIQIWILLALIVAVSGRYQFYSLLFASFFSFLFSFYVLAFLPDINSFYLLPTGRLWEAGIGFLAYYVPRHYQPPRAVIWSSIVVMLIITTLDVRTHYYLWYIFVILSGILVFSTLEVGSITSSVTRYVSNRTYGLYLFHVPLLVLTEVYLQASLMVSCSLAVVGSFIFASVSKRYLEV
jgi:peptidoglycan/LPS O-acetylase OafA/YrhL